MDISAKNRNKYWKSIKERLLEPEVFEKEMHLENAARLVSASGAVSSGFTLISWLNWRGKRRGI